MHFIIKIKVYILLYKTFKAHKVYQAGSEIFVKVFYILLFAYFVQKL